MDNIIRLDACFVDEVTGNLIIKKANRDILENTEMHYGTNMFNALAHHLLDWDEIGKLAPVIVTVETENDRTGDIKRVSFLFKESGIYRY